MTWTILMLVAAVAVYVLADKIVKADAKKPNPVATYIPKVASVIAIILVVVGVNRLGLGTSHYLVSVNPVILREMAQNMQAQEQEQSSRQIRQYVRRNQAAMLARAPVLGNVDGSKTIFVWTAPSCGFARRLHADLMRVVEADPQVRVAIKHFPIHGALADIPARWTIAAKMQDNTKAVAMINKIMTSDYWGDDMQAQNVTDVINRHMRLYARELGLDVERMEQDINSETVNQELANNREFAQRFSIQGTPFVIIGDQTFPGAIPFQTIMNALR